MSSFFRIDTLREPMQRFTDTGYGLMVLGSRVYGRMRLPTEPIGTFTLTLTNLVVGSMIKIETQAGASVTSRTAASSTEVFSLSAYQIGSALNDLRVKVRKGTAAPFYKPYETLTTGFLGSQSVYIAQIAD